MQTDTNNFNFDLLANSLEDVSLYFDSKSNDKLYYSCSADFEFFIIDLVVVINEKYNYKFDIIEDTTAKQLSDYTVNFSSESSRGQSYVTYRGWIKVQTETVYFNYVQTPETGEDEFLESIQQIVKVKK